VALVVEDGSGLSNSESYISVADATTYHSVRGNTDWAALASDTVREQLLRKANDYLKAQYRLAWAGARKTTTQALDWPRVWVPVPDLSTRYIGSYYPAGYFPNDEIPPEVKAAAAILALIANAGPLMPDIARTVKSESVGPISVTYADNGPRQYPLYTLVDNLLVSWLDGQGNGLVLRG